MAQAYIPGAEGFGSPGGEGPRHRLGLVRSRTAGAEAPAPAPAPAPTPGPDEEASSSSTRPAPKPPAPERRDPAVQREVDRVLAKIPERLSGGGRRARKTVTRDTLAEEACLTDEPELSEVVQDIWDVVAEEGPLLGRKLRALSKLWGGDAESPFPDPDGDIEALAAATGMRVPVRRADHEIRDASHAVSTLPACLAMLEEGVFPAPWFTHLLRRSRRLEDTSRLALDEVVRTWNMLMGAEGFFTKVNALICWLQELEREEQEQVPVRRDVRLRAGTDGLACLEVTGPAPELLATSHRLDVTARAVQAAQRLALEKGTDIPWDVDGSVAESGKPAALDALRYLLLTRAELDPQGVEIPAERFRITVTVPALTLLGAVEAPGLVDGHAPIPADLARLLAAEEPTWYRVLTDPCSGAFLPMPADAYRPSRAMQEHLRLRSGLCAVPGCERSARVAVECDHIQEWLEGGPTDIENLHWLCRFHHQEKTEGRIDPVRLHGARIEADGTHVPGLTRWRIRTVRGDEAVVDAWDQTDLVGTLALELLDEHYRYHPKTLCDIDCRHFGQHLPRPPGEDPGGGAEDGVQGMIGTGDSPRGADWPGGALASARQDGFGGLGREGSRTGTMAASPPPPPSVHDPFDSYGDPPF
ncbi:HNH endonuclease signature motif containing protein [Brachybacterium hainanense]|uniref:HNH endonuclease signature motif containing protein n=1 Tax=Brachybacterium hainanense TaxID=1541174 RepID=A0ABV6RBQ0_9MICO